MIAAVFIDTTPLVGLNYPRDQHARLAQKLLEIAQKQNLYLLTTDYIIDEAATLLLHKKGDGYRYAMNLFQWIFDRKNMFRIEWINADRFYQAKTVFQRFNKDKQWSFTDCTSYVVMKELKIKTVFTFDIHFEQMGFELLA